MAFIQVSFAGYGLFGNTHAAAFFVDLETGDITAVSGPQENHWVAHGMSNLNGDPGSYDGRPSYAVLQRDHQLYTAAIFYPHAANGDTRGGPPANVMIAFPEEYAASPQDIAALMSKLAKDYEDKFMVEGGLRHPLGMSAETACHVILQESIHSIQKLRLNMIKRLEISAESFRDFKDIRILNHAKSAVSADQYNSVMQSVFAHVIEEFLAAPFHKEGIAVLTPRDAANLRNAPVMPQIDYETAQVKQKQGLSRNFDAQSSPAVTGLADAYGQNITNGLKGLTNIIKAGGPEAEYAVQVLDDIVREMQQGTYKINPPKL